MSKLDCVSTLVGRWFSAVSVEVLLSSRFDHANLLLFDLLFGTLRLCMILFDLAMPTLMKVDVKQPLNHFALKK